MTTITVDANVLRTCLDKSVEDSEMTWGCQIDGDCNILTVQTSPTGLCTLTIYEPGDILAEMARD